LYKQFAITIAISVAISGFVALTLTPAMCAVMLKHTQPPQRGPFAWFNRWFDQFTQAFGRAVVMMIRRMAVAFTLLGVMAWGIYHLFQVLPTSFVPNEDQGYILAAILLPDAASMERTTSVSERIDAILQNIPAVENRTQVIGFSLLDNGMKSNAATYFITLKPFEERYRNTETAKAMNARAVLMQLNRQAAGIQEGLVIPISPPSIPGIGTTGGFEFWIQDTASGDPARLEELTGRFLAEARKRPELAGLSTTFRASSQQLKAVVDRDQASLIGVPINDIYNSIQAQFGSLTVSQYNDASRVWWVVLQSDARFRQNPEDLTRLYTRSDQGYMVPLSAVVRTEWTTGPDMLPHFNGFPSSLINGNAASGFSSGQAIQAMEEVARNLLPQGYSFAWSGLAYEEKKSGGTSAIAMAFGLVFVFLILAAQYESWTLPGSVMTAVPFGIFGALLFNWIRGLENDVYFQIGLLVLVGLGAKNALLRVTFAVDLRKQGHSLMEATILAGEMRLRPIIMTSLAFIFGVLPLAIAMGAGANARHSIGTGIIGGMIGEATLAMLYVPLFYYLFDRLERREDSRPGTATTEESPPDPASRHLPPEGS
jgi:multidrug efflux pump